ncbi:MAG: DUF2634 domain-containing protein [Lachnospiraceae bacterium]|nr:DUF2634 domain-containing protein [Lachnospiraceae bacterium]
MIPSTSTILATDFETTTQPTHTYAMNLTSNRIRGYTDGQEAMKQAIYKILNTERYQYIMYSWNYGIELQGLFGQPISYVVPELERRITEALTWDDRINSVSDFVFDTSRRGVIAVSFTVNTIYGDVSSETEVNI